MIFEYFQKYQKERNIFLPLKEIREKATGKIDQYCSIFGYNPEDVANGDIYGPLYFDIDNSEISKAYTDAKCLIEILKFYGLTDGDFQICFSGCKGFHIVIHPEVMGVKPTPNLDKIYKKIATWFYAQLPYKSIDFKVYERRRLWRIINTINSKSGLYKIQINGSESLEEIMEKAKTQCEIVQKFPTRNETASTWLPRAQEELRQEESDSQRRRTISTVKFDDPINPSVKLLIDNGVGSGERNNTAFYLACYLKSKNFGESEIEEKLLSFATKCTPPMEENEIRSVIKSANRI